MLANVIDTESYLEKKKAAKALSTFLLVNFFLTSKKGSQNLGRKIGREI